MDSFYRQIIVVGLDEYNLRESLHGLRDDSSEFWADHETHVELTETPNTFVEVESPWKIHPKGESKVLGHLHTEDVEIGLRLTFSYRGEENLEAVTKFFELIINKLEKAGGAIREPKEVRLPEPKRWEIKTRKDSISIDKTYPSKPEKPEKPAKDAPRDQWFDYYHQMKGIGFKYTLNDLASDLGLSHGHVRDLHILYKINKLGE